MEKWTAEGGEDDARAAGAEGHAHANVTGSPGDGNRQHGVIPASDNTIAMLDNTTVMRSHNVIIHTMSWLVSLARCTSRRRNDREMLNAPYSCSVLGGTPNRAET